MKVKIFAITLICLRSCNGNWIRGKKQHAVEEACPENETFVVCRSSSCFDKVCDDVLDSERMKICTRDCARGCACDEGFVRGEDGVCHDEGICFTS